METILFTCGLMILIVWSLLGAYGLMILHVRRRESLNQNPAGLSTIPQDQLPSPACIDCGGGPAEGEPARCDLCTEIEHASVAYYGFGTRRD
jgi:hypothetical protein